MMQFLLFSVGRYAGFFSHLSAFLAGLALWISLSWGVVLLAVAVVLGSFSAFSVRISGRALPGSDV